MNNQTPIQSFSIAMEMLTSTPSSPVYPQRVTLQSGIPNTVTRVEVMKVSLLRSPFSPAWSTWAMVGPDDTKWLGNLSTERALAYLATGETKVKQCIWNLLKNEITKDTLRRESKWKTEWVFDLEVQSGLRQWTPGPHQTRQRYTLPVWPKN